MLKKENCRKEERGESSQNALLINALELAIEAFSRVTQKTLNSTVVSEVTSLNSCPVVLRWFTDKAFLAIDVEYDH